MKKTNIVGLALLSSVMLLSSCGSEKEVNYQYNTYMSGSPSTWNVHTWQTNDDAVIIAYTESGLYDFVLDRDESGKATGYKIVSEMADGEPIDTALDNDPNNDLTDEEVDNYAMDYNAGDSGVKWIINLNKDACWEDGTPINADTYIYSMQKLLDPAMQNYRASSFYVDTLQVANAENYFKSNRKTFEQYSKYCDEPGYQDADHYYSFSEPNEMVKTVTTEYTTLVEFLDDRMIPAFEKDPNMFNAFQGLVTFNMIEKTDGDGNRYNGIESITLSENQKGYKSVLANRNANAALTYLAYMFGASTTSEIAAMTDNLTYIRYQWPAMDWSHVGLVKSGEYQLTFYLAEEIELFYMKYNLAGNWLVYEPYYEAGMTQNGDLKITNYATKQSNYMSYGPYKLTHFQVGKSIILERNENWYGYKDGKHVGEYQTSRIKFSIISEHSVALQKFLKGELDDIGLTPDDMKKYGRSERLYKTQTTYSQKLTFNTDWNKLSARQTAGKNKTILSNHNFREAFSYAMDRSQFASEYTSGHVPSTVLLNNQYISDYNTNEVYRETAQGQSVSKDIYGDIQNGFSVSKAKELFTKAYNEEVNSAQTGHLEATDRVEIQILLYNTDSEASQAQILFIRNMLKASTEGTPLEGKIDVVTRKDEDYYNTAYGGDFDCIWSIWGGMTMDPFGFMQVYTSESIKCEYGFHPENEPLTLSKDILGENAESDVTMTYDQWRQAIATGGIYAKGDHDVRLNILAALEKAIILRYETICFTSRAEAELLSYKVNFGCEDDLPLVGRGGIREMTYNYNAEEWAKIRGKLDYTVSGI